MSSRTPDGSIEAPLTGRHLEERPEEPWPVRAHPHLFAPRLTSELVSGGLQPHFARHAELCISSQAQRKTHHRPLLPLFETTEPRTLRYPGSFGQWPGFAPRKPTRRGTPFGTSTRPSEGSFLPPSPQRSNYRD